MKNISNLHLNQSFSSLFSRLNKIQRGQWFSRAWSEILRLGHVIIRVVNAQVIGSVARTEKITNRRLDLTGGLEAVTNRGEISFFCSRDLRCDKVSCHACKKGSNEVLHQSKQNIYGII